MTPKHIITMNLEEIKAVEIHCLKCGGFTSWPLKSGKLFYNYDCPSCGVRLAQSGEKGDGKTSAENRATQTLLDLFKALQAWESAEVKPFQIRFTIEATE